MSEVRDPRTIPPHLTAIGHGMRLTLMRGDLSARPRRMTAAWIQRALRMGWITPTMEFER